MENGLYTNLCCYNIISVSVNGGNGLGFMGQFAERPLGGNGFSTEYSFWQISPRIYFEQDGIFKTFYIKPSWGKRYEIRVDDKVFRSTDRRVPLILLIEKGGEVRKIESFEQTFGITLDSFLQHPSILTPL